MVEPPISNKLSPPVDIVRGFILNWLGLPVCRVHKPPVILLAFVKKHACSSNNSRQVSSLRPFFLESRETIGQPHKCKVAILAQTLPLKVLVSRVLKKCEKLDS